MSLFKKKKNENLNEIDATDSNEIKIEDKVEEESAEEEVVEAPKTLDERRKQNGPFKGLGWIFKIAAAALLLAIFFIMVFNQDDAMKAIITVTGTFIALLCIARLIFYFMNRKNYTKYFKIVNIIEIILDGFVGLFLIFAGVYFQKHDEGNKFYDFMNDNYRFFVGAVLYLRGALHFFATAFFKARSTIFNYSCNLAFVTLGTFCLAYDFTLKQLVILLIVVVALSCLYLSQDGIRSAIKYWNGGNGNEQRKSKKKDKDKNKDKEIPAGIIEPETEDRAIIS